MHIHNVFIDVDKKKYAKYEFVKESLAPKYDKNVRLQKVLIVDYFY